MCVFARVRCARKCVCVNNLLIYCPGNGFAVYGGTRALVLACLCLARCVNRSIQTRLWYKMLYYYIYIPSTPDWSATLLGTIYGMCVSVSHTFFLRSRANHSRNSTAQKTEETAVNACSALRKVMRTAEFSLSVRYTSSYHAHAHVSLSLHVYVMYL